ncbi:Dynein intermediate chain 1- axonemal-like 2, partial [Homarus americanus]
ACLCLQVRWVPTEVGETPHFYSASADGRVCEWAVQVSTLQHTDLLDFHHCPLRTIRSSPSSTITLQGTATCIAFNPWDRSVLLMGADTGAVFQLNTSTTTHVLTHYPAHNGPVRAAAWNTYHNKVFATCSLDWMIKIWLQYH